MALSRVVDVDDTIVAIGSSTAPATRGVVRLSGPNSMSVAVRFGIQPQSDRRAHRVDTQIDLGDPLGQVPVRALIWPSGRSYTGQPSLELHTYGSLPILNAIVRGALAHGCRAARPGEFTLRAFLAGRLDLTQAEAVLGVIDADHRGSLDHALRQLAGNLSRPLESLRSELLDLLADVEAGLDFVDEDIQFISDQDLVERLTVIIAAVETTRDQLSQRTRDKSEWIVALRGLPNAGKSRLLNALAGHDAAIVSDVAGTTRDVVSVPIQIQNHPLVFIDTAGIETVQGQSALEQISQQAQIQASRAGREADIRLWCVDRSSADWQSTCQAMHHQAADKRRAAIDLWVATKSDSVTSGPPPAPWIATSGLTGDGIDTLREELVAQIEQLDQSETDSVAGTAARCAGSLQAATTAIQSAIDYVNQDDGHEYVSSELRLAAAALGEVTGAVYTDDILDRVFSRFCIGK
ncbi:tRNA modification GTPase [Stieleria sp. TO1_6]|uniref:tRNA modification GTPase n=1 Tax=Stieleria tagensis TaxID=2956795 RepID=UPI00209AC00B|nr:tRNA modification GTPase [Stieleria tagensis]MCO8121876.1 tRNA modification GTPase [Stieleria tagensis]